MNNLRENRPGWVIINIGHPTTGNKFISYHTFSWTRKEAIAKFIKDSGSPWTYWRKKYNFRAVRAEQTIKTFI
jgi:hypothetical protein